MHPRDFGWALQMMQSGKRMCRTGWNGKGMWVTIQRATRTTENTLPYLYIQYPVGHAAYPQGARGPWLASQADLLTEDWEQFDGE